MKTSYFIGISEPEDPTRPFGQHLFTVASTMHPKALDSIEIGYSMQGHQSLGASHE